MSKMKIGDCVRVLPWDAEGVIVAPATNYDWEVRTDASCLDPYTRNRTAPWNESELTLLHPAPAPEAPKCTPKLGEVWTNRYSGVECTCIDDVPDDVGHYGWRWTNHSGTVNKAYSGLDNLDPPKVEVPEWLTATPWVAIRRDGSHTLGRFATSDAALGAIRNPLGALNVLTGEWVPR